MYMLLIKITRKWGEFLDVWEFPDRSTGVEADVPYWGQSPLQSERPPGHPHPPEPALLIARYQYFRYLIFSYIVHVAIE